ncbi:MAG: outer membrane beta-barrel domain-containing protein [Pseudobdellovibrionaceae bacterium]
MKLFKLMTMTLILALVASAEAQSKKRVEVSKDVDSLGGNKALVEMATSMDPKNRSRIVQNRLVDRHNRLELHGSYGAVAGGDSYLRTQNVGAAADFHFTPRWSLGVRYYDYSNQLTPEGERVFNEAREAKNTGGVDGRVIDIDYPLNSVMGILSWYPIYGKTNLMDYGIAQFDMYLLAGGGSIQLNSGSTGIGTAGAGVGFWVTQNFSIRTELRYQTYQDKVYTGDRKIDTVTGQIGLGLML